LKSRKSGNLAENYCEFCGGGDIYIEKRNTGAPLVVFSGEKFFSGEELNDEEKGVPSPRNDDNVIGLTIKGKKDSCDTNSLLYQLFANTILTSIPSFIKSINNHSDNFRE